MNKAFSKWSYKSITLEMMMAYIDSIENTKERETAKEWFKSIAFIEKPAKMAVPMFDTNGNPIMKQKKDANGNEIFKDGKPVLYHAKKMVPVADAKSEKVFSLLKAKKAFCEKYCPELLPTKKAGKKKVSDILANW